LPPPELILFFSKYTARGNFEKNRRIKPGTPSLVEIRSQAQNTSPAAADERWGPGPSRLSDSALHCLPVRSPLRGSFAETGPSTGAPFVIQGSNPRLGYIQVLTHTCAQNASPGPDFAHAIQASAPSPGGRSAHRDSNPRPTAPALRSGLRLCRTATNKGPIAASEEPSDE